MPSLYTPSETRCSGCLFYPFLDPINPTNLLLFIKQRLDREQASSQRSVEPSTRQATQYHETFTLTRITSINPLLLDGLAARANRRLSSDSHSAKKVHKVHRARRLWKRNVKKLVSRSRLSSGGIALPDGVSVPLANGATNKPVHFQMYSQVYPVRYVPSG